MTYFLEEKSQKDKHLFESNISNFISELPSFYSLRVSDGGYLIISGCLIYE